MGVRRTVLVMGIFAVVIPVLDTIAWKYFGSTFPSLVFILSSLVSLTWICAASFVKFWRSGYTLIFAVCICSVCFGPVRAILLEPHCVIAGICIA
jgi:hypothetical protein